MEKEIDVVKLFGCKDKSILNYLVDGGKLSLDAKSPDNKKHS